MNTSKPPNSIRGYAGRAGISALILLSPVMTCLFLIVAEALVDSMLAGGTGTACAVAGAVGLALSQRFWRQARSASVVEGAFGRVTHV
jgi:hypothetical protein